MYRYDGSVSGLGFVIIIVALFGAVVGAEPLRALIDEQTNFQEVETDQSFTGNGRASENGENTFEFSTGELKGDFQGISEVRASLSWVDEDPSGLGSRISVNDPDTFSLDIESPWGQVEEGTPTDSGSTSVTLSVSEDTEQESGEWIIRIKCGECGDYYGPRGNVKLGDDTSNEWDLTVNVGYTVQEEVTNGEGSSVFSSLWIFVLDSN
ncbi:MAG: hypothetical protein JSV49_02000 [Thermoplasmata archaeon]|nr:MAG: hypothetical protein JSV49_02000 [Thermoplasmata archaeon]